MSRQSNKSNLLVELSAEEQQLLSGGCYQSRPCCKPKKCCGDYQQSDQYTPSDRYERYPNSGYTQGS